MQKTKIDWCDMSWNPVTGCLHGCEYCYARKIANRFTRRTGDGINPSAYCIPNVGYIRDTKIEKEVTKNKHLHVIKLPMYDERIIREGEYNYHYDPYPYGFEPTFHKYRLDEPQKVKKPQNIFVCSMADLFGDWVPDEWIKAVFEVCEKAPQHRYLFLTKNPRRYEKIEENADNLWYGATTTNEYSFNQALYSFMQQRVNVEKYFNTFISIEPILDKIRIKENDGYFSSIDWVIIGAETGNRENKVIPEREWILEIKKACERAGIPLFMKESLRELMGEDFIQEFPW